MGRKPCSFVGREFPERINFPRRSPRKGAGTEFALAAGRKEHAMQTLRDWYFPVSLFAAWTITAAYTLALISGAWIA
jgi:hypothetical protein